MKLHLPKGVLTLMFISLYIGSIANADNHEYTGNEKVLTSSVVINKISKTTSWIGTKDEYVNYSNNTITNTSVSTSNGNIAGGVLGLTGSNIILTISGYGDVSFDLNKAEGVHAAGASIICGAEYKNNQSLIIKENTSVSFNSNQLNATMNRAYGGAIFIENSTMVSFENNGSVTLNNNVAISEDTYAQGGAIYITDDSSFVITGTTGDVELSNNRVNGKNGHASGGAISGSGSKTSLNLSNNKGNVILKNNTAETSWQGVYGGAIDNGGKGIFSISENEGVEFSGNAAINLATPEMVDPTKNDGDDYFKARGGAINTSNENLEICGNESVFFLNNYVRNDAVSSSGEQYGMPVTGGGAIYSNNGIKIQGNGNTLFAGNYEKTTDGVRLRAIYSQNNGAYFSAKSGSKIEFQDGITLNSGSSTDGVVHLNSEYNGQKQDGKIVFTGKYTESLLTAIKNSYNAGDVTDSEIRASRTFEMGHETVLYAGTLSLEDAAIFTATEFTVKEGATLAAVNTNAPEISLSVLAASVSISTTEVTTHNDTAAATLSADLSMADGSALTLEYGHFDLDDNDLTLGTGIALNFSVLDEVADGDSMVLFSNVNSVNFTSGVLASEYFTGMGIGADTTLEFVNGTVSLANMSGSVVPEPATATLSLLALAGLAARRRRASR